MKRFQQINIMTVLAALLLVLAFSGTTPADELRGKKGLHGKQSSSTAESSIGGDKSQPAGSAANDPRAIIKEGFLGQVDRGRISLINMESHRVDFYRLEDGYRVMYNNEDYRVLYGDEDISLEVIPPSSIVQFILIEGQVREIILLQRSS